MAPRPLGRNQPTDFSHVEAFPLSAVAERITTPVPVVAGTDWLTSFDTPQQGQDGKWRVPTPSSGLGTVRGGHCYCFETAGEPDTERNWAFYDQGQEGACEGFGNSRALTLMLPGSPLLDAFWLYDDARRIENTYPEGEGSTNRAAAEALRKWGDHPVDAELATVSSIIQRVPWHSGVPAKAIKSFHWATTVEEIRQALGFDSSIEEFPILNSWGKAAYPHRVYMPAETIDQLLKQGAEYTILVPA